MPRPGWPWERGVAALRPARAGVTAAAASHGLHDGGLNTGGLTVTTAGDSRTLQLRA